MEAGTQSVQARASPALPVGGPTWGVTSQQLPTAVPVATPTRLPGTALAGPCVPAPTTPPELHGEGRLVALGGSGHRH